MADGEEDGDERDVAPDAQTYVEQLHELLVVRQAAWGVTKGYPYGFEPTDPRSTLAPTFDLIRKFVELFSLSDSNSAYRAFVQPTSAKMDQLHLLESILEPVLVTVIEVVTFMRPATPSIDLLGSELTLGRQILNTVEELGQMSASVTEGLPLRELSESALALTARLEEMQRVNLATNAAEEAVAAAEDAKQAAGDVGTSSLSEHFTAFAREEELRATWRQLITGLLVLLVVGLGVYGAFFQKLPTAWSAETLVKLTLSVPLLALAYYFAREASHHSAAAQRAREIEVRLRTVRAYTAELPDDDRIAVRAEFAKSLFTVLDWGAANAKDANELGKEMTDTIKILADALASAAGRAKDGK
jgi:hypothetical protein